MNQNNNIKISGCGGRNDINIEGKINQSQREIFYNSAVEGPLFGDYDDEPSSYDHDLALSKEHAISLAPAQIVNRSGFAEFDDNNDFKVLKSNCLSDLRKKPSLMPTKTLGVTFSEPVELKFYTMKTNEICPQVKENAEHVSTETVGVNSISIAAAPLTNLAFYQMKPNCDAVDNMIALAGAGQFCIQFQLDAMQTIWDMTEDPTLLAFLHDRGATSSILQALSEASRGISGAVTAQHSSVQFEDFEESTCYESTQVLALAMLALCNLAKCPPAMEQITSLELSALEQIVSYCSRFINNRGVSPHPRDAYLGVALQQALAPAAIAVQCQNFIGALLSHLKESSGDSSYTTASSSSSSNVGVSAARGNARLMQDLGRICTAAGRPCSVPNSSDVTITTSG